MCTQTFFSTNTSMLPISFASDQTLAGQLGDALLQIVVLVLEVLDLLVQMLHLVVHPGTQLLNEIVEGDASHAAGQKAILTLKNGLVC